MNEKEFEFLGITAFHKAGYTGKNIKIASCERIIKGIYDDVTCPEYGTATSKQAQHGTQIMGYIRQVLPDAQKFAYQINRNNLERYREMDIVTTSYTTSTFSNKRVREFFQELIKNDVFLGCAIGNDGTKSETSISKLDEWMSCGAMSFKDMKKRYYSSVSKYIDFISFDGLDNTYSKLGNNGSSFSIIIHNGLVGLIQDYFIVNTGKKLPYTNLLEFIKAHCIDYGTLGFDNLYGYGLFLLPDPNKIDPNKWNKPIKIGDNEKPLKKLLTDTLIRNKTNKRITGVITW
jgi:hypothetical protein